MEWYTGPGAPPFARLLNSLKTRRRQCRTRLAAAMRCTPTRAGDILAGYARPTFAELAALGRVLKPDYRDRHTLARLYAGPLRNKQADRLALAARRQR